MLPAALAALASTAMLFCACVPARQGDALSASALRSGPGARILLERIMPEAMADGIVKVALLINEQGDSNTWQFIEAAVAEGRSMGFIVDAFALDADADREAFLELAAGIAGADYDGLIFVNGEMGFSYDILRPIADSGMRIVTLEALPFRYGTYIDGLVTTFQDNYRLANLSLEALVSHFGGELGRQPNVARIAGYAGVAFLDRHEWEFNDFARRGEIVEAGIIRLHGLDNPRASAWEAVSAALPYLPPGSVDALWVPWSEFAIGAAEALAQAERRDIRLFSTGVSNESLRLMQSHGEIWIASTTIDHKLTGAVTMRILAALLAGETLESTFYFSPQLVRTEDLNRAVNMGNISMMLPNWETQEGLFDGFPWMEELKAAESRYLRISPASVFGAAQ